MAKKTKNVRKGGETKKGQPFGAFMSKLKTTAKIKGRVSKTKKTART